MRKIDKTIGLVEANLLTLLMVIPLGLTVIPIYLYLWGDTSLSTGADALLDNFWIFAGSFVVGIVVHELLHGLTWQALSGKWGSVKYGMMWHTLMPYAHLKADIGIENYRIGAWMPGLILGILPLFIGLACGLGDIFWFGMIFTWAAGGDILIIWLLRDVPTNASVTDHPKRVGCYVYLPEAEA